MCSSSRRSRDSCRCEGQEELLLFLVVISDDEENCLQFRKEVEGGKAACRGCRPVRESSQEGRCGPGDTTVHTSYLPVCGTVCAVAAVLLIVSFLLSPNHHMYTRLLRLALYPKFCLLLPPPQTLRQYLQLRWKGTKNGQKKTLPPIPCPPSCSPVTPLSPCFEPKSRPLINLKVPSKSGQSGWIPL